MAAAAAPWVWRSLAALHTTGLAAAALAGGSTLPWRRVAHSAALYLSTALQRSRQPGQRETLVVQGLGRPSHEFFPATVLQVRAVAVAVLVLTAQSVGLVAASAQVVAAVALARLRAALVVLAHRAL